MKKFLLSFVFTYLILINCAFGYTKIYDMTSEKQPIASGTTYQNIKRLTTEGWLNINILEVDLEDEYTEMDMLIHPEGIYQLATVKEHAVNNGAVAAINSDFFSWVSGKSNGSPIGFEMKDGEIVSSAYYKNAVEHSMLTFSLDENNFPFYNYIKTEEIKLVNENGESIAVADINKVSSNYENPVVFNAYWSKTSFGNSEFWDMVEFVVEDGRLKEIRDCREGVTIPKNGYVVCARGEKAYQIKCLFNVGDKVELVVENNIDMSKMKTAISGGTMLVTNGQTLENSFTHDISGYHPRTAVGTSKDNKTLYMVTVDGRGFSKGVTQTELAYLMAEIGCYHAVNLDGGGSTQMVGRLPGDRVLSTLNVPTENRKVINALGILSTAPKSSLSQLKLSVSAENVFVNHEVSLSVKGYDKYVNPIEIPIDKVKWKVSGVSGSVDNSGAFSAKTSGIAKITATYAGVSESIEVRVLGDVGELKTNQREIVLAKGQTFALQITAKDIEGYTAEYKPSNLRFTTSNLYVTVSDEGVITAKEHGSTLITIYAGETARAFVKVTVTGEVEELVCDFEEKEFTFRGYPTDSVDGDVTLSSTSHTGNKSAKLDYDFTDTSKTRGAYLVFEEPILIDKDSTKVTFWAYSKKKQPNIMLKVQVEDAEGKEHLIQVAESIDSTKWTEYEIPIANLSLPTKLQRIYVAELEGKKGVDSSIFIDSLYITKKAEAESAIVLPENTRPIDLAQREAEVKEDSFQFIFCGDATSDGTLYDELKIAALNKAAEKVPLTILGKGELTLAQDTLTMNGKYGIYQEGDLAIIKIANSGSGILATYPEEWTWLIGKLETLTAKHLLLLMPDTIENSFSDKQERLLFEEVIAKYEEKNNTKVTFLSFEDQCGFSMIDGRKNIFAGNKKQSHVKAKVFYEKYVLFTLTDGELTYEFLPMGI
ncbi:MAG: phosphodiester glycosidase family protein [Clostridia bacterium]|nr:phosphodiester glycosidase family protein [Clostridia bacterium]